MHFSCLQDKALWVLLWDVLWEDFKKVVHGSFILKVANRASDSQKLVGFLVATCDWVDAYFCPCIIMLCLQESDNLWWDAFATEFFEDEASMTMSFCLEDGPKRYSKFSSRQEFFFSI